MSHSGYIKRVPLSAFRAQRRGGKGRAAMATREEDFVSQIFVADTHTPVLFFSTSGMVYKTKVYRLPLGTPQARGRALVNLLPLEEGETISTVMPLPEDETAWDSMFVMFATSGDPAFGFHQRDGERQDRHEARGRRSAHRRADLPRERRRAARRARRASIRFAVSDVRVFSGRTSTGVRGIRLGKDDSVVSMSILAHVTADARRLYCAGPTRVGAEQASRWRKRPNRPRRATRRRARPKRSTSRSSGWPELEHAEEFILTVAEKGFGKRSCGKYRSRRGGQGIVNIATSERNGSVISLFPSAMAIVFRWSLVTDGGQLIRCPVADIRDPRARPAGRGDLQGHEAERVVSVIRLEEIGKGEGGEPNGDGNADADANGRTVRMARRRHS